MPSDRSTLWSDGRRPDREAAEGLAEMLGQLYRGRNNPREFRLLDFTHYNPKPRERTLEIWLPG